MGTHFIFLSFVQLAKALPKQGRRKEVTNAQINRALGQPGEKMAGYHALLTFLEPEAVSVIVESGQVCSCLCDGLWQFPSDSVACPFLAGVR